MSGHSHWATIKHKKGAIDAKRGKLWSKLSRAIIIAARNGGGDPTMNLKLRYAIDKAREVSMPKDNIDRAIKRGTGESGGEALEELTYEGFGPGGTAILIDVMTDNRNRTAGEIRNLLTKNNGNLSGLGSVAWMFKKQGVIVFDKTGVDENRLTDAAVELGADDVRDDGESFAVVTEPKEFERIRDGLAKTGLPAPVSAEVTMVPQNTVHLTGKDAQHAIKLLGALEDHEDIQNVHSNLDVDEATLDSVA
jgi:YebC/PmpR family DNA-binding regulatory protein